MELSLHGKTALITGGNRGIGFDTARIFGQEGANIAICARGKDSLSEAVSTLRALGINVFGMTADVSDPEQFRAFADAAEAHFGGMDIWINNAGSYPQMKMTDMTAAEWDELFAINVRSVFLGAQLAKEKLMRRNGGVLFNAASFAALIPSVTSGAYGASKAAIASMTRSLAAELAPHNIRVIGYIPGVVETDMTRPVIEQSGQGIFAQQSLQRLGRGEDVAYPLLFLASDYASYITGAFIEITGGKFCVQNPLQAWS